MKEMRVGDTLEHAIERADYPPAKVKEILGNETVAVIGYGVQGRGQSLNMRDNGVKVVVGQRAGGKAYDALRSPMVGSRATTLFDRGRSGQTRHRSSNICSVRCGPKRDVGRSLKPLLTAGKALYFSHGFSIVYQRSDRRCAARRIST